MTKPIITVENLGKAYRLGLREEKYPTFRDALVGAAKAPFKRFQHLSGGGNQDDLFWALKDVSFEVQPGEVVGIIGRNGAGKSTLLKVLSRITDPTAGRAVLRGRVASLLEVGTGFHPELSGRENIYLNGSILGMKKVEIDRKFDEIVAFAEVEKFLDTPVKRYSSGMYVRLAFAVAAHLEPEILIVDEVLAVGDAQFQKKCLGKMQEVAQGQGRTVLFVSHNMAAVQRLCKYAILLADGQVRHIGETGVVVDDYLHLRSAGALQSLESRTDRYGSGNVRCVDAWVESGRRDKATSLMVGQPACFCFAFDGDVSPLNFRFTIYNAGQEPLAAFSTDTPCELDDLLENTKQKILQCNIDSMCLSPGRYSLNIQLDSRGSVVDRVEGAFEFEVAPGVVGGRDVQQNRYSAVILPHRWSNTTSRVSAPLSVGASNE
ncbi:ABC transporter ATP-binding protein [Aeoliella sp. ICT_H6.2]|uniref:ABC transporter ATP-binding protein n=1 Tax=Aeoliella straminimaris TaxID=2954799 RepID=A0A9X2FC06_9BACT|nr:ABC transporter ATP-binding protein [Aeoliella straminimaris]MCO6045368.1 ABC transporter ATP-binding protein [Aeoliella straminimaris]